MSTIFSRTEIRGLTGSFLLLLLYRTLFFFAYVNFSSVGILLESSGWKKRTFLWNRNCFKNSFVDVFFCVRGNFKKRTVHRLFCERFSFACGNLWKKIKTSEKTAAMKKLQENQFLSWKSIFFFERTCLYSSKSHLLPTKIHGTDNLCGLYFRQNFSARKKSLETSSKEAREVIEYTRIRTLVGHRKNLQRAV